MGMVLYPMYVTLSPFSSQSKRHHSKDSSLSFNFHGNEPFYLKTQGRREEFIPFP